MQNSKYNPLKNAEMTKQNLNFNGNGKISLNIAANTSTNLDFKILDDCLLTGAHVIVKDSTFGDSYSAQIVDVDGLFYPAGSVLLQFITSWGVKSDVQDQGIFEVGYPAKVIAGLYIRVVYTSTGQVTPSIITNYYLHKILA